MSVRCNFTLNTTLSQNNSFKEITKLPYNWTFDQKKPKKSSITATVLAQYEHLSFSVTFTLNKSIFVEPWKWGATARYYTSHTKTMLPMRKSVPRSRRQLDYTKTSWRSWRDANCSGMVMFPVHQVWPNHLARHSERGKKTRQTEEEVGRQHQGMDRPGVW